MGKLLSDDTLHITNIAKIWSNCNINCIKLWPICGIVQYDTILTIFLIVSDTEIRMGTVSCAVSAKSRSRYDKEQKVPPFKKNEKQGVWN